MTVLALSEQNVSFIWVNISAEQILSHWFFYINNIFVQFHKMLVNSFCIQCAEQDFSFFVKCCRVSDHFSDTYANCKWCDHITQCFIQDSDESWCSHDASLSSSSSFLIHIMSENHWLSDFESWSLSDSISNNVIMLI